MIDYTDWFKMVIYEVYPKEPGMLDIGLLNKRISERIHDFNIETRLDELGKVPLGVSTPSELVSYRIDRFAQLYQMERNKK